MNNHKPITERTEEFAIRIIKACSFLSEQSDVCRTLSNQFTIRNSQFTVTDLIVNCEL